MAIYKIFHVPTKSVSNLNTIPEFDERPKTKGLLRNLKRILSIEDQKAEKKVFYEIWYQCAPPYNLRIDCNVPLENSKCIPWGNMYLSLGTPAPESAELLPTIGAQLQFNQTLVIAKQFDSKLHLKYYFV